MVIRENRIEFKKKPKPPKNTTQNPNIHNHKDILLKKISSYSIPLDPAS